MERSRLQTCNDCRMQFSSVNQLNNHCKKFCIRSPYGNIDGLEQKQRVKDILDNVNVNTSNLHNYGNYSLEALQNMLYTSPNHKLNQKALRNKEQQFTNDLIKYQQTQRKMQYNQQHPSLKSNRQMQTSFAGRMKLGGSFNIQYDQFTSPPSYIPNDAYKKTQAHQSAVKNMSQEQKWRYAQQKLKELQQLKYTYLQNNGTDSKFLTNLQNLHNFYQGLKTGKQTNKNSRLKTPIAKLQDYDSSSIENNKFRRSQLRTLNQEPVLRNSRANTGSRVLQGARNTNQLQIIPNPYSNNYQNLYQQSSQPYPNQYQVPTSNQQLQPIIIMPPPYYSHQQSSMKRSDSKQKSLVKRLQQLLNSQLPKKQQIVALKQTPEAKNKTKQNMGLVQNFNNGLLPQERVLQALQRQQFQQLRMLSNLPPDLQRVKMDIIKQTSSLRSQVQKQIQQQRILRMRHQLQMQQDHEQQLYQDQLWVDKQRKKQVSQKLIQEYQNDQSQE